MKRSGPFKWTPEADAAFEDLKRYLMSPPIMVVPRSREPLLLYLAATPQTASAALVAVREERVCAQKKPAAPVPPEVTSSPAEILPQEALGASPPEAVPPPAEGLP
jgi:hypothetical protein